MPAPSYIGNIGTADTHPDAAVGAEADETGINLDGYDVDMENPQVDYVDRFGAVTGLATNHAAVLNYTISGEVGDVDAGVLSSTFVAALTMDASNKEMFASASSTHMGVDFSSSAVLLTGASWTQPRGAARAVTINARRPLGFAVGTAS